MADRYLRELTDLSTPAPTDLVYVEHDPTGTPVPRKTTLAELAASDAFTGAYLAYAPAPSGDVTGATDTAAILAHAGDSLQTILQPGHYYINAGVLNFDDTDSVTLLGCGGRGGITRTKSTTILDVVDAGSATAISAKGTHGFRLDGMEVCYSNAGYTGILIDGSGDGVRQTDSFTIGRDVCLRGYAAVPGPPASAAALVKIDASADVDIRCAIANAVIGVYGKATNGSFANKVYLDLYVLGGISQAAVWNPDKAWTVEGTYEPLTSGAPGMIGHDAGVNCRSLTIGRNTWVGDETVAGAWVTVAGDLVNIESGIAASMLVAGGSFVKLDDTLNTLKIGTLQCKAVSGGYLVDLNGKTLGRAEIASQDFSENAVVTALVNGTLPVGSRVTDSRFPQGVRQVVGRTIVGAGGVANVTFSSIPQTGRLMKVSAVGRSDKAAETDKWQVRFNSDSGANYSTMCHYSSGTAGTTSANQVAPTSALNSGSQDCAAASAAAGAAGYMDLEIPAYANTSFNKIGKYSTGYLDIPTATADAFHQDSKAVWGPAVPAAITSVTVFMLNGNLAEGTIVTLEIE